MSSWGQCLRGEHPAWVGEVGQARQGAVASHELADHPVLPCSPAVLLVRGARPPAAAPTSEEPPERSPRETPHAAPPQLHELHETHSVAQVSGRAPPGWGQAPLGWVLDSHPSGPQVSLDMSPGERTGVGPLNSQEGSTFSKIRVSYFKSSWVSAICPPSKQKLKVPSYPA